MSECEFCNEELNGIPIICPKCGKHFCSKHKLPRDHHCVNLEKEEIKETEGPADKGHDQRSKEKEAYIEEEVQIIKRRVRNETPTVKFFKFIINHHMLILIIALIIAGIYVQTQGVYDIKGKAINILTGVKTMVINEAAEPAIDDVIEYSKTNDTLADNPAVLEDKRTLIQKIQDTPSLYINTEIEVEGLVEWKEIKSDNNQFQYVLYDENRRFIPFLFKVQQVGFNKYSKYKIYGIVKKDGDLVYIDAHDTERMI